MKTKLIVCLSMLWLLCNNPLAAQHKMVKLSNFDPSYFRVGLNDTNNIWAYTNIWGETINGREFAFIGVQGNNSTNLYSAVAIVDVSDPLNPYLADTIHCPSGDQRDFVTYVNQSDGTAYLYIIGEGASANMIIADISALPSPHSNISRNYTYGGYDNYNGLHAHNIQLDKVTGKMIVCGTHGLWGNTVNMFLFDVASNPAAPILLDSYTSSTDSTYYVHDVYFDNDKLYTASIKYNPNANLPPPPGTFAGFYETDNTGLYFDLIHRINPYPVNQSPGISIDSLNHVIHDVYVSQNHNTMVTSDEHIMGQAIFWDISNPTAPVETDRYSGHLTPFVDTVAQHNHVIKGNDRCYVAHYSNGLWVLDISDPYDVREIAYYDTYLEHNYGNYDPYRKKFISEFGYKYGTAYYGAWGVFADLPSGNILVCDMNNGLYVVNNCVPEDNQSGANLTLTTASYSDVVYGRAAQTAITVNPGSGNFIVGTDANVTLIAGSKISLKPGFHAQADGKFHAQIGFMCQNCDECPDSPPGISKPNPKPAKPQRPAATADRMEFYPNPTTGQLQLKMNIAVAGYSTLSVCDQFGRTVLTVLENRYTDTGMIEHILDVSALPAGIYTLKLHTASGIQTSRFTKIN